MLGCVFMVSFKDSLHNVLYDPLKGELIRLKRFTCRRHVPHLQWEVIIYRMMYNISMTHSPGQTTRGFELGSSAPLPRTEPLRHRVLVTM